MTRPRNAKGLPWIALAVGVAFSAGSCTSNDPGGAADPSLTPSHRAPESDRRPERSENRFSTADACPVVRPSELPDGTAPGPAQRTTQFSDSLTSWGEAANTVVIGRGRETLTRSGFDSPRFPNPGGEPVIGADGVQRWVIAVGDPPLGQIAYKFVLGTCPYVMWTASGMAWAEALWYAAAISTPSAK